MKKRLSKPAQILIKTLIITLIYFGLTEILIRKYVLWQDDEIQRSKLFKKSKIMNTAWGDSQMRNGFGGIKNFINLSSGSQSFQEIEKKLKQYYQRNDGEGLVILQASINSFSEYRNIPIGSIHKDYYLNDKLFLNLNITSKYFQKRAIEYWINFISNNFTIKKLSSSNYLEDGSIYDKTIYEKYSEQEKKLNLKNIMKGYDPGTEFKRRRNFQAFQRISEYFKNNKNLKLCLVSLPWHPDLNNTIMKSMTSIRIKKMVLEIARNNNFAYIDMQDKKIPLEYFGMDTAHLNMEGSKYISKEIVDKCTNLTNNLYSTDF